MSPENQWLEDVFPIEIVPFFGDMLVFGGGKIWVLGMIVICQKSVQMESTGQFITTFPAGWSPQMVVKSKGIPAKMALN